MFVIEEGENHEGGNALAYDETFEGAAKFVEWYITRGNPWKRTALNTWSQGSSYIVISQLDSTREVRASIEHAARTRSEHFH